MVCAAQLLGVARASRQTHGAVDPGLGQDGLGQPRPGPPRVVRAAPATGFTSTVTSTRPPRGERSGSRRGRRRPPGGPGASRPAPAGTHQIGQPGAVAVAGLGRPLAGVGPEVVGRALARGRRRASRRPGRPGPAGWWQAPQDPGPRAGAPERCPREAAPVVADPEEVQEGRDEVDVARRLGDDPRRKHPHRVPDDRASPFDDTSSPPNPPEPASAAIDGATFCPGYGSSGPARGSLGPPPSGSRARRGPSGGGTSAAAPGDGASGTSRGTRTGRGAGPAVQSRYGCLRKRFSKARRASSGRTEPNDVSRSTIVRREKKGQSFCALLSAMRSGMG